MTEWLTRDEALERLRVRAQTLYAYVSRGRIGMRPDGADPRRSQYRADDIAALASRRRAAETRRQSPKARLPGVSRRSPPRSRPFCTAASSIAARMRSRSPRLPRWSRRQTCFGRLAHQCRSGRRAAIVTARLTGRLPSRNWPRWRPTAGLRSAADRLRSTTMRPAPSPLWLRRSARFTEAVPCMKGWRGDGRSMRPAQT